MSIKLAIHGGNRELHARWPEWPMHDRTEERALLSVLRSGKWWYGDWVRRFERDFASFQGVNHAVTTTSGTAALEIALAVLGVGPGDEVIVPAYTFVATASAALRVRARVVFADVVPQTLDMDPADLARKITRRTRAIIPVHIAGNICDMDRINSIARRRRIPVVEDACHAWGSKWKGRGAGGVGACGAFSFQVSKNITAGEGGMMVTNRAALAERLQAFTHVGRRLGRAWYAHFTRATNARMTEFQAAVLCCQLARLKAQTLRRQANARILDRGLGAIPGISPQFTDPRHTRRSYHFYIFRVDSRVMGVPAARFASAISAEGVPCMTGWSHPVNANPLFTGRDGGAGVGCGGGRCLEAERACRDAIWITHRILLAPPSAMRGIVRAVAKVVSLRSQLR